MLTDSQLGNNMPEKLSLSARTLNALGGVVSGDNAATRT
jgi:hypothetical protein